MIDATNYTLIKKCNNCGTNNDIKNNVCTGCGQMMVTYITIKKCNSCGTNNNMDNNVCIGCGLMMVNREDKVFEAKDTL
jgi:ribosomal protein L32